MRIHMHKVTSAVRTRTPRANDRDVATYRHRVLPERRAHEKVRHRSRAVPEDDRLVRREPGPLGRVEALWVAFVPAQDDPLDWLWFGP